MNKQLLPASDLEKVTHTPFMRLLAILSIPVAALNIYRIIQRTLWLMYDFRRLGLLWEDIFLVVQEGIILLEAILALLTCCGLLSVTFSRHSAGCGLLRRLCSLRRFFWILLAMISLCLTALLIYLAIHYRMTVTIIGLYGIIGLFMLTVCCIMSRLYRNTGRVLRSLHLAARHDGCFVAQTARRNLLGLQIPIAAAIQLIPLCAALLQATIVTWAADLLARYVPGVTEGTIRNLFNSGITGISAMYSVDSLRVLLTGCCYLLLLPVYARYCRVRGQAFERLPIARRSRH